MSDDLRHDYLKRKELALRANPEAQEDPLHKPLRVFHGPEAPVVELAAAARRRAAGEEDI